MAMEQGQNDNRSDNEPLIDFSFLHEISDADSGYIHDVIEIFLGSTPQGLEKLKELIQTTDDWDAIGKQAHFLKSSVSVIKIKNVYDQLAKIEQQAHEGRDKEEVTQLLNEILLTFEKALPVLEEEMAKNRPA